ncbi:Hsp70 family protein [Taibaiella helva]|uniref:Hsp70 family protein n=1 Tax=Taibaiella helva TaxID=2301235 RepID=UPI000E578CDB|nr:Hsp70 family protein [Taibaiella helva]
MRPVNFGIDLGTTNSLIGRFDNGSVTVYQNPIGHKETLASVVAFRSDRILVGDKAREYMLKDAVNVFGGFKRRMGTDEKYYVVNLDENVTPVQLSAYVLQELQRFVHGGEKPEAAVITIPASFDTMQSNATHTAGREAGLKEVFLLQEPIAASLAYFNQAPGEDHEGCWIVYDLGGGTFDVALVQIKEGEMKVVDHEGNNFLGGLDFDLMIVEQLIVPEIVRQTGIADFETELSTAYGPYEKLYYELLYKAEEAKKELSSYEATEIEFSTTIGDRRYDFNVTIDRAAFNQLLEKRVEETLSMLRQVLERNQLAAADIRQLILVGGSTFIPYVQERLELGTGIPVNKSVDPTTAVAVGAAYYAANKYYTPSVSPVEEHADIGSLLDNIVAAPEQPEEPEVQLVLSYSKMSKEPEEVLLVKVNGNVFNYSYRIVRADGGFDTGFMALKAKFTEFLPLLPGVANVFRLTLYDGQNRELPALGQELTITHGQYSIAGQPLPKDICIEVDDRENHTTKLELVFEKNSILPLKKTLYREISKTIKKGSDDKVIINIQEGDRYARPLSNLTIGCIEIQGKDLKSDLIKGSDIEIQLLLSDNRELSTEVYLVMTGQEFKNVFALSEKCISVARLREQFNDLEAEIRKTVKGFNYEENEIWAIQANSLLDGLLSHKASLHKLKDKERSDKKYVIAEAIGRISQEYDKIGGNERLQQLQAEYLHARDYAEQQLPACDFEQDRLKARFAQLVQNESQVLRTRNPSILQKAIGQLNDLIWEILTNTTSYLIVYFHRLKAAGPDAFTNYGAAQSIVRMADKALEQERFFEFRQHVYNLSHLLHNAQSMAGTTDFKGTGIG